MVLQHSACAFMQLSLPQTGHRERKKEEEREREGGRERETGSERKMDGEREREM
jgi:hypothetical protein